MANDDSSESRNNKAKQPQPSRVSHTTFEVPSSDEEDTVAGTYYRANRTSHTSETAQTVRHWGSSTQSGQSRTWGGVVGLGSPADTQPAWTAPISADTAGQDPAIVSRRVQDPSDRLGYPMEDSSNFHLMDDEAVVNHLDDELEGQGLRPLRPSDNPMQLWLLEREEYLREEMASEGRRGITRCCGTIHSLDHTSSSVVPVRCSASAEYRCLDCDGSAILCQGCVIDAHQVSPLHRIQKWINATESGGYFTSTTLAELGYRVQLGHAVPGEKCPRPVPSPWHGRFTVIDVNGIHELSLDFCGCHEGDQDHGMQIRQFGWFPATVRSPRSAATIRVLNLFQLVSFESKASTQDFYRAIERCTSNTGLTSPKNLYPAFLNMTRQFGHLKMLKRSGRGNDAMGAGGTREGELALLCPACPHPGINLPNGWQLSIFWFLYILFVGIDANFRLRRKMISNSTKDPSLSKGNAYFVDSECETFTEFLDSESANVTQQKSTCSNHDAVNKHREGKGLASTGIAAVDCIRHDFKRPTSVVDLQKGERYCNIDFAFFSSMRGNLLKHLVASYDICCQWSINLPTRTASYPDWMTIDGDGLGDKSIQFLVPKFHLPAHILACQTKFSFNYHKNVGRTDGEGVERAWSNLNHLAGSTREMGPGARQDALNNHMGDRNWKKTCHLVVLLRKRIRIAVPKSVETRQDIEGFSKSLMGKHAAQMSEWGTMLDAWEADPLNAPNPLEPTQKAPSYNKVRIQLAQEEAEELVNSVNMFNVVSSDISASQMISMGIELEARQRRILAIRDTAATTDAALASLQLKSNILLRQIESWIRTQEVYIPTLHAVRTAYWDDWRDKNASSGRTAEIRPEHIPLLLPSSKTPNVSYDRRLAQIEWQLRHGQASDALDSARESARLKAYVTGDKVKWQRGQRANTRSNGILSRLDAKKLATQKTYMAARKALIALAPELGFLEVEKSYPELKIEDIVSLRVDPSLQKPGQKEPTEGQRAIPWIWTHFTVGTKSSEDSAQSLALLHENLRIEWCKGRARADRWSEEILLLMEEQRRVVAFFEFRAQWWDTRAQDSGLWSLPGAPCDEVFHEGRKAYALQQAAMYRAMAARGNELWADVPAFVQQDAATNLPTLEEENIVVE